MKPALAPTLIVLICTLLVCIATVPAAAQSDLYATGRVVGHVYCGDTDGRPARLAKVWLRPVPLRKGEISNLTGNDLVRLFQAVTTDVSGRFVIPLVKPGSYFVLVDYPGYESAGLQYTQGELSSRNEKLLGPVMESIPQVTVQTGITSEVNIQLQRGATISGTVRYDDGSPAEGVTVEALEEVSDGKWRSAFAFVPPPKADDRGNYRLSGLAAGKYILKCTVSQTTDEEPYTHPEEHLPSTVYFAAEKASLTIYNGGAFRPKDAKPIALKPGADMSGIDVVIPLAKLHTISGVVTSLADGHSLNGGDVELLYQDDGKEFAQTPVLRDGGFRLPMIPDGEYLLKVEAEDREYGGGGWRTVKKYEGSTQPLDVWKDIKDLNVQLKSKSD